MKHNVFIARFPFGRSEDPDVTDWFAETIHKAKTDPRIGNVDSDRVDDTPITMGRNLIVEKAKAAGADILVMVDNDMSPDLRLPGAKPFWDSSLEFLLQHNGPCIIGAPYCGPPPYCSVYVFRWASHTERIPRHAPRLEMYGREDAAVRMGMEEVGALPTGLIMIDMRVFQICKPPHFYYEWTDKTASQKASTEDVTFTRDTSLLGVKQYVNWDAWAGHWKRIRVGKPDVIHVEEVHEHYKESILRGAKRGEKLVMVNEGRNGAWVGAAR